jgi:shikimate kinase
MALDDKTASALGRLMQVADVARGLLEHDRENVHRAHVMPHSNQLDEAGKLEVQKYTMVIDALRDALDRAGEVMA